MCFTAKIPTPPRQVQPEDAATAGYRQRQMLAGQKGFASTVLTSPMGAQATPQQPKTVLGG